MYLGFSLENVGGQIARNVSVIMHEARADELTGQNTEKDPVAEKRLINRANFETTPHSSRIRTKAWREPMTTSDRASWIDTEGTICLSSRTWEISIVQTEKKPLQDYSEGAHRDGVRCFVRTYNNGTAFRARIVGLENVARELSLTENLLRTANRLSQVRRFKQYLFSPRRVRIQTLRARQIITDRLNQKSGASANLGKVMRQMVCKIPLNELKQTKARVNGGC